MKKYSMRVLACFMACVVAFNVIAIPRAKAVAGATTLGTAALAGYMTATGVPLTVISGGAGAAASGVTSIAAGYAAATGTTTSAVLGGIASGATITAVGTLALSAVAVAALAAIAAWAIKEYGLLPGTETEVYQGSNVTVLDEPFKFTKCGTDLFKPYELGTVFAMKNSANGIKYQLSNGVGIYGYATSSSYIRIGDVNNGDDNFFKFNNSNLDGYYFTFATHQNESYTAPIFVLLSTTPDFSSVYTYAAPNMGKPLTFDNFGEGILDSVSASLDAEFEAPIEIPETQQMVIDVGAGEGATEETVYNLIFNQIADGTLSPTYEVTDADAGADSDPDTGVDSEIEVGLLERIANGIDALADKITEGFAEIFAPDPALMQDISNTFNSKFGFVSTLHQLGTDLLSIDATSTPPVVYIHLEDAEGSIYYGETVKALDMSWYARYKEDVDRIMSGFLWLGFLWLLFKRASAIINGAEMATDYGTDIHDGFRIRGERNGKRF